MNFYHFGDGSTYPKYRHSIYLEWSRTTKGSGINQFTYDSEYLIPGIRFRPKPVFLLNRHLIFMVSTDMKAFITQCSKTMKTSTMFPVCFIGLTGN
ncbi:MAG: hypothetical protein HC906_10745 [Bacteroidales bacterium]|nr:hypothetical protein [Bacteroidales bacterium]